MLGLLIKDIMTYKKQGLLIIIFTIAYTIISIMQNDISFLCSFLSVLFMMLPITALAYDERAKWDRLALTMPISKKTMVTSKYVLGLLFALIPFILSILLGVFVMGKDFKETFTFAITVLSIAMIYESIVMPICYKCGTEKARIAILAILLIPVIAMMLLKDKINIENMLSILQGALKYIPIIAVAFFLCSMLLSISIYNKKEF